MAKRGKRKVEATEPDEEGRIRGPRLASGERVRVTVRLHPAVSEAIEKARKKHDPARSLGYEVNAALAAHYGVEIDAED